MTIWKTNNAGTSANNRITIPATGTNYTIDWEEVGNAANNGTTTGSGSYTLAFPSVGTYQVSITKGAGSFDGIAFNNGGDRRKLLKITKWGDTRWQTMEGAYDGCSNLTITATDVPDLQDVTSMAYMFYNCAALTTVPAMNTWDVSNVTNMSAMFSGASAFNQSIGTWNVSNVTNMFQMFGAARTFNQPLKDWNVSNVTDMSQMFLGASVFNQEIATWDVGNVTSMAEMFNDASVFNQPLGIWDVSKVTDMMGMFYIASAFNRPIETWDVSQVTSMVGMFYEATAFNQPIGNWDVSKVTDMNVMFYGASAFNQPLGAWNLTNVTEMIMMLNSSAVDCKNLSLTLQGWAGNVLTPSNITLGASGRDYGNQAAAALATLRNTKNWTISIGQETVCAALDVTLISFDAAHKSGKVNLKWTTAAETDNDYFEVQRSTDARQWMALARVKGGGTVTSVQNYTGTDLSPLPGISYYRLKIVDLAGKADYSRIRPVNIVSTQSDYIYPNPATSSVTLFGMSSGVLTMYNVLGQKVKQAEVKSEKVEISVSELPVGTYTIKMDSGWSTRFIKN
ncbi:BspA family leucine-rich repeat surface protein [Dyadobacter sp. LHD-138]|uniref:BspA family leucine-rich repeat surface protein n=1 Tax=Dyadobacter sp. LHD-138 TaxID=3071413 RepID=UPI0027DEE059|nr:BspA family leucine-rich repeat surface protein [Dyadobacter sp. LHD-138]MDQ6481552.1 BspA family leucine-rich repeat surface protein [Dyadobacter sp. LHD-138]